MKSDALIRIRKMLTPEVTIINCTDKGDKLIGQANYRYHLPLQEGLAPIPCDKVINFVADKEGNVLQYRGIFG